MLHSAVRKNTHMWKTYQLPIFQWMYHPKVRLCSPQTAQWATSQALQASLSMLNAEVYDSTISERLRKYSSFQGCQEKACPTLASRKKLAAWFEKLQLNQFSWWISFGQSGVCQTWCCPLWPNTKYCISAQTHHTKCTVMERWWFSLFYIPK